MCATHAWIGWGNSTEKKPGFNGRLSRSTRRLIAGISSLRPINTIARKTRRVDGVDNGDLGGSICVSIARMSVMTGSEQDELTLSFCDHYLPISSSDPFKYTKMSIREGLCCRYPDSLWRESPRSCSEMVHGDALINAEFVRIYVF